MRQFIGEIGRRKVGRVIIAYAVTAFVVLQVADIALPALGAPAWVMASLVVLAALGFPVAAGLAWAFDITPGGITRTPAVTARDSSARPMPARGPERRRLGGDARGILLVAVAAALSLSAGVWYVWPLAATDDDGDPDLVAILPFRVSGDAAIADLREGMVELLATALAGDAGLRPADPGAVLSSWRRIAPTEHADLSPDSARIVARMVGAGRVLQGSVVAAAGELVITASLLPLSGAGRSLNASARGPSGELLRVVDRLTSQLLSLDAGETEHRLATLTSTSLPALRAYLVGQAAYRRSRFHDAIIAFDQAVAIDSTFALAALNLHLMGGWGDTPAPNLGRSARLAWQYRDRLSTSDRILLDARLGRDYPRPRTVARIIADWEDALTALPDRADVMFMYGDILAHRGALADIPNHEEMSKQAFARALAIDSSFTPALTHLLDHAIFDFDTASARRLFHLLEQADTSYAAATYQYWTRSWLLGDSTQVAALRAAIDTMAPADLAYVQIAFAFGLAPGEDAVRAAELQLRRALTSQERNAALSNAYQQALLMGRPAEALRHAEAALRLPDPEQLNWHTRLVLDGLFWDGDTAAAGRSAVHLETMLQAGEVATAPQAYRDAACAAGQWRGWHGEPVRASAMAQLLDGMVTDSADTATFEAACSLVIRSLIAHADNVEQSRQLLQRADSIAGLGPSAGHHSLRTLNFSIARLHEVHGSPALALRAVRRHVVLPATRLQLSTRYREEGRLADQLGDRDAAIAAYTRFLALRTDPESALAGQIDEVRARLAAITQEQSRQ
jgi:tetratricopeptide (TPR) repeat protein